MLNNLYKPPRAVGDEACRRYTEKESLSDSVVLESIWSKFTTVVMRSPNQGLGVGNPTRNATKPETLTPNTITGPVLVIRATGQAHREPFRKSPAYFDDL